MAEVDRISALPDDIKICILSRLSIADAVRTSVLSRSWRHLWTLLSGFRADPGFLRDLKLLQDQTRYYEIYEWLHDRGDMPRLIGIIERLLSSLRGPIRHFTLYNFSDRGQSQHLHRFLDLISQKGNGALEELSIHNYFNLPLQLPYFRSLKELRLYWVTLSLPPDFQGFDHLTTLELLGVQISQHDLNALIDGSKKLASFESPYLIKPGGEKEIMSVTFNSPLLKSIRFHFEWASPTARVASAPCLERAEITAEELYESSDADNINGRELSHLAAAITKFMADVAHVSQFSLDTTVLKCLSHDNARHTLPVHFPQLRCLNLVGQMFCIDKRMSETFCCLLRSMPCLEFLQIECYCFEEGFDESVDPIPSSEYMKKQDGFRCFEQTLRKVAVSMSKLSAITDIMWMMYFILFNANVLECIEITFEESDPQETSSIIKELREVEKASLDAKVVLWDRERHREY